MIDCPWARYTAKAHTLRKRLVLFREQPPPFTGPPAAARQCAAHNGQAGAR